MFTLGLQTIGLQMLFGFNGKQAHNSEQHELSCCYESRSWSFPIFFSSYVRIIFKAKLSEKISHTTDKR